MTQSRTVVLLLSALSALSALAAATPAQDARPTVPVGVHLVTVPERLRLPAEPGGNLLLQAEVASADAVWLAAAATAADTVPLVATGDGRHQTNLADPRIAVLLPAGVDSGELFVFARARGAVVRSAGIGWSRAPSPAGAVRCFLRSPQGTRIVEREQRAWLDLGRTTTLEVHGAGARQGAARARWSEIEQPLRRRADHALWQLDVDDALRERCMREPVLELELQLGSEVVLFAFDLVPPTLDVPPDGTPFTVAQRRRGHVPGSRDWLGVRLGDLTMGKVRLELTTAEGTELAPAREVHERDHVEFALGATQYVLVVDRLVNHLLGDDHGEFTVRPAAGFRADRIGLLLRAVAASGDTFVREGKEYDGPMAAQFLLARLGSHRGTPPTVDEFVATFASQSSRTGVAYQVRTAGGATITMREWLQQQLDRIEAAAAGGR
jgi:hypothetical protein